MLTKDEIRKLREKIDERQKRFRESLESNSVKDPAKALASLVGTEGWDIVRSAFEEMICELLVPDEGEDMTDAQYMVLSKARLLTIHAIESVVGNVDAAAAAKAAVVTTEREEDKPEEGVSE